MNRAKLIFSATMGLGIAIAIGCSSSSNHSPTDGGVAPDTGSVSDSGGDAENVGSSCNPLLNQLCPQGQTCCFSGLRGTCTEVGSCASPLQVSCLAKANCGAGAVCCGSVQFPAGFDASGFDAAGFDASSFDASDFDAAGFGLTLACSSACAPPDFQLCANTQECPVGDICTSGAAAANMAAGLVMACIPADAGAGFPVPDGGPGDGSTEAGPALDAGLDAGDGG